MAIPVYNMSSICLPNKTSEAIDKIFRAFLWDENEGKKKSHTIKWAELRKPNTKEGLGIRDTKNNNLALLVKTCWRCLTYENLLC